MNPNETPEPTPFRDRLLGSTPAAGWRPTKIGDYLIGVVESRGSRIDNYQREIRRSPSSFGRACRRVSR